MRGLLLGLLFFGGLVGAGCDDSLGGVGATCTSSGECATGLLCDFTRKPHVCEPMGEVKMPDMAVANDLAGEDFAGEDFASAHD